MRRLATVMIAIWVILGWTEVGIAQQGKVPPEVLQEAQTKGVARVIVQLDVATRPEGALPTRQAVLGQRQAIAGAQGDRLAELSGTTHKVTRRFETIPFIALEVTPDALAALERSARVVGVVLDRLDAPSLLESAPLVEADQAWAAGFEGTGWTVAVLDSGVDKDHPFLLGKVVAEACFSANSNCPDGSPMQIGPGAGVPCDYAVGGCQHGTHVAGIAAGRGPTFSGVARGASLIAVQVFSRFTGPEACGPPPSEDPCSRSFASDGIAALEHVLLLSFFYDIASVNLSLGGGRFTDQASCDAANAARKAAIDNLRSVGIATVAASGNDGFADGLNAPGCISTAVSVGSTTKTDDISGFSNSAPFLSLLAPGSEILSSIPGGGFGTFDGTSQATPHVAGAWAILKQSSPTAGVSKVLSALRCTGLKITDPRNSVITPRIRVRQALDTLAGATMAEIIDVPFPGTTSTVAIGINDAGQIVGTFAEGPRGHGFLRDAGGIFTTIDGPGATLTELHGINNAGQIVGFFRDITNSYHGFLRDAAGSVTTFDVPGAAHTRAYGINDAGQIVGTFVVGTVARGFLRDAAGSVTTFDVPGATFISGVSGINDAGQIVGSFFDGARYHGFLRDAAGSVTTIDAPGATLTLAYGINDAGEIVGQFDDGTRRHGFLRDAAGSFTTIDGPGATSTNAFGINNAGQIVGIFDGGTGRHGFVRCGA